MTRYIPGKINNALRQGRFLLLGAFLFFPMITKAQFVFDNNCKNAYQYIFSCRFKEARQLIEAEKKLLPSNHIPVLLENYIDFLILFTNEDPEDFSRLSKNETARLTSLEDANKNSPYYRFTLAQVQLQWAFARVKFGEFISAVIEIRGAKSLLEENKQLYPGFMLNNCGLGLIHTMAGIVPDQYKWLANLLGFQGSVEQGTKELNMIATYAGKDEIINLFKPEVFFYLSFIESNLRKDKAGALQVLNLTHLFERDGELADSPLITFSKTSILMKTGRNDEAIKILSRYSNLSDQYKIHYLTYLLGLAKLNRLDPDADHYFLQFLQEYHGLNYIKSAYQKLAWCCLIKRNKGGYLNYLIMAREKGVSVVDEDKQALIEARKKTIPNLILFRARLLFDGGYYNQALQELTSKGNKEVIASGRDFLEYTYRLGRIYHEIGNISIAKQYYEQTIKMGSDQRYYYTANAALYLGLISESEQNYQEANRYYQLCLSLHYDEYKNSISQKAKAGLERVQHQNP
ncbi:MAG: hypothetical protein NTX61_11375 [Bacteroidetes bacterium]|nr:hypothetical protein [Bacteroidota bacterium]